MYSVPHKPCHMKTKKIRIAAGSAVQPCYMDIWMVVAPVARMWLAA